MRPFGYHITGGEAIGSSLLAAAEDGWTAAQVFLGPPQSPRLSKISDGQKEVFLQVKRQYGMKCYVHAPYVLHAFAKPENVHKNNHALRSHLALAAELEMDGYVVHMGGTKWYYPPSAESIWAPDAARRLLDTLYKGVQYRKVPILFENCASGNELSGQLSTIENLVATLRAELYDVGICLDTCHAWAWGNQFMADSTMTRPLEFVDLVHLNSAPEKVGFGSKRDLHESLLDGTIPLELFYRLLSLHPETPVVVERDSYHKVKQDQAVVEKIDRGREQGIPFEELELRSFPTQEPSIFELLQGSVATERVPSQED